MEENKSQSKDRSEPQLSEEELTNDSSEQSQEDQCSEPNDRNENPGGVQRTEPCTPPVDPGEQP